MTPDMTALCWTAASVGFLHTVLGPDHYVPFAAIAQARKWSMRRTMVVTLLCGVGHILGSIVLGLMGITLGIAVFKLESIESARGEIAGWIFIAFGIVYTVWGLRRAIRGRPHSHVHVHVDGTVHTHKHTHESDHAHIHDAVLPSGDAAARPGSLVPWTMFVVFVFGPCEALIPFLMYPAAKGHFADVLLVTAMFAVTTLATMSVTVMALLAGFKSVSTARLERYTHALAGFAILACGIAVKVGL